MSYISFKIDFTLVVKVEDQESSHIASVDYYDSGAVDTAEIDIDFEDGDCELSDEVVDAVNEVLTKHFSRMTIASMREQDGKTIVVKYDADSAEVQP